MDSNLMNDWISISTYGEIGALLQECEEQRNEECNASLSPGKSPRTKRKKNRSKRKNAIIIPDDDELYDYCRVRDGEKNSDLGTGHRSVNEQTQKELVKELDTDNLRNEEIERFYLNERYRSKQWTDCSDHDEETPVPVPATNVIDSPKKIEVENQPESVIKKKNKKIRNAVLNSLISMGKLPTNQGENSPAMSPDEAKLADSKDNATTKYLASSSESSKRSDFFLDDAADKLKVEDYILEKFMSSFSKTNKESDDDEFQSLNNTNSSGEYMSASSEKTASPLQEIGREKKKGYHKTSNRSMLNESNIRFVVKMPLKTVIQKPKPKIPEQDHQYTYVPQIVETDFNYKAKDFPPLKSK